MTFICIMGSHAALASGGTLRCSHYILQVTWKPVSFAPTILYFSLFIFYLHFQAFKCGIIVSYEHGQRRLTGNYMWILDCYPLVRFHVNWSSVRFQSICWLVHTFFQFEVKMCGCWRFLLNRDDFVALSDDLRGASLPLVGMAQECFWRLSTTAFAFIVLSWSRFSTGAARSHCRCLPSARATYGCLKQVRGY